MATKKQQAVVSVKELKKQEREFIREKWHRGTIRHCLLMAVTVLAAIVILVVMVLGQFFNGPSVAASDMLTQLLHQSSALKFVPYLFLFDEASAALERGTVLPIEEATDASLITVRTDYTDISAQDEAEQFDENGIRIEEVVGATYHGYMMVVRDPSRVSIGTSLGPDGKEYTYDKPGKRVDEIRDMYGAVAIMNGGGFHDHNGTGNGGMPEGMVITGGKLLSKPGKNAVAAFDQDNILHVGVFSEYKAEALGFRDACGFGPALIVNGKAALNKNKGLNPRAAIGQRADGAVLLLVIDGRQANSLGATVSDVIDVMQQYGAVNACNMDGGSSATMYYGEEKINDGMTVSVSRRMPTCWIVK